MVEVDDAVLVLHDRAGGRARVQAARLFAVKARVLLDQPLDITPDLDLVEAHEQPGIWAEVTVALHTPKIFRWLDTEFVPLLTRDLASLTTDAARDVDQLRVLGSGSRAGGRGRVGRGRHSPDGEPALRALSSLSGHALSKFTRNALNSGQLVLASPTKGVRLLAMAPVVIPLKPQ